VKLLIAVPQECATIAPTYLVQDVKRVEDVDSSGPDHAANAVRYGCLRDERIAVVVPLLF